MQQPITPESVTQALATFADPERVAELRDTAAAQIEKADTRFRELCREHPFGVLAGAAAVGFVLGRLLSRR
ncbi:MAG: hypothetical protein R3F39_18210 [Myxococcota bacterium]